jgi:hypothetical protein
MTSSEQSSSFDPHFPAAKEVCGLTKGMSAAQVATLSHLANLSIPVASTTAEPESLDTAIVQVQVHGETLRFWGDIFAKTRQGTLSREELDQRLINWVMTTPGMEDKVEELPDDVKCLIHEFRTADLASLTWDADKLTKEFKIPISLDMSKTVAMLKEQWEILDDDAMKKYSSVVEEDGSPVKYVENIALENWDQTIQNTPSVILLSP